MKGLEPTNGTVNKRNNYPPNHPDNPLTRSTSFVKCKWCNGRVFGKGDLCSHSCAASYGNSLRPAAQHKTRLRAIAREIYVERHGDPKCKTCGSKKADIHHRDENLTNNSDKNLIPLCRGCHIAHHNHVAPKRKRTQDLNLRPPSLIPCQYTAQNPLRDQLETFGRQNGLTL